MMNMENEEYIPTTTYNTTIDLAIIHCNIAAKANWDIYESFASDHFAIIISWYPGPLLERTLSQPKFQMNKADWPKFQEVINTELIGFQSSDDIDDYNQQLLHMLTNAAEQSIPKSTQGGAVKKYWRYDLGVKCAKQDYNRANRHYRQNRTDDNKITMREKFDIYNEMCKHVQERS